MSDIWLRIIPSDPKYVPPAAAAREAEASFRGMVRGAEQVAGRHAGTIEFVDCGSNLESARCPACGQDLLEDDSWQGLMDEASESGFAKLSVVAPCCGTNISLNDVKYDWPCGFASFVLEAMNPGGELTEQQVAELASKLGCAVRVVRAHL
jgi:hypothetical protein